MATKKVAKKNQNKKQKKNISTKVKTIEQNDVQQFENKLLEIAATFESFAKLNKHFLKNCNSSFKKYTDIAKEYKQVKTNLTTEKKKYSKLSSLSKVAIKQNQKLRHMLGNAMKIISLKNGVIKGLKKKVSSVVIRKTSNESRMAI